MPELPEVERVRSSLEPHLVGRMVVRATVHRRDVIVGPGDPPGGWARNTRLRQGLADGAVRFVRLPKVGLLEGARIRAIRRHGKELALVGQREAEPLGQNPAEDTLAVHLGMTGQLVWYGAGARLHDRDHIHLTWRLDDASRLVFRDPRRFGVVRLVGDASALAQRWGSMGPDARSITADALRTRLSTRKRPIKAGLLDQHAVAGVGNIYADESLHAAGIRPDRLCIELSSEEYESLAFQIRRVLGQAIEAGGSTIRDYRDADANAGRYQQSLAAYGRGGEACVTCGNPLISCRLAQRTTTYCATCQT